MLGLAACESKGGASTSSPGATASGAPVAAPLLSASAKASAAVPSAAVPPSASAATPAPSASAGGDSCPADAKRYDEPRFCVVFPSKPLDVSYEGGPNAGTAELESLRGVLRFTWGPVGKAGKEPLKARLEKVSSGDELVASGELPGSGAWSHLKLASGKHLIQSATKSAKLVIDCNFNVDAAQAEAAAAVCKSLRTY